MDRSNPIVEKVYAYVTRSNADAKTVLAFRHPHPDGGVQVPKGTVEAGEAPREAVVRELGEESGLEATESVEHFESDEWSNPTEPRTYRRHFFHVVVTEARDEWTHRVTGSGPDEGMTFRYFWVDPQTVELAGDMGDYLDRLY